LHLPFRRRTTGGQQRQPRPLAISIVEQLREQALGIAQGLMATGRGRRVDDHQPDFMGRAGALLKQQIGAALGAAIEQRARPVHRSAAGPMPLALAAIVELSGTGLGIRPRVGPGANA
jgi:hypothetical protein